MRKALLMVVAVLVGFAVAATGFSQVVTTGEEPQVQEKTAASGKRIKTTEPVKRFLGEVVSIDVGTKLVTAKGRRGEAVFDLSNARIARNIKLEDLKPGDRIGIVYIEKDDKKVAKAIGKPMTRSKRSKATDGQPAAEKQAPAPETK